MSDPDRSGGAGDPLEFVSPRDLIFLLALPVIEVAAWFWSSDPWIVCRDPWIAVPTEGVAAITYADGEMTSLRIRGEEAARNVAGRGCTVDLHVRTPEPPRSGGRLLFGE